MKQLQIAVLTLFFALAMTTGMLAQVRVNPKVGVNVSAVDAKLMDINAEARAGWNAGVDFRLGKGLVFLNPGIHYYTYTARLLQDLNTPDEVQLKDETQIQNLRLPVNLGFYLTGTDGLLRVFAKGGVTPAYLLGVREKESFAFNRDSLKDWTFGANVGLGVDLLFLTVDLNYEIGLTDFFADAAGRNNMLTLSAGIKF
ncbi:MAG TPA: outer membrane beta-barrel protein [Saprospiraceae bacterium]|nr:outer membrane beta-barrel protein [Saprospiraceae bacterium]HMP24210.1 outer membrane beta-barrel protein [Saprospiraceae bacterium]